MSLSSWLVRFQQRWGLKSLTQVIIILIVFACTGFTVLWLKAPIQAILPASFPAWLRSVLYFLMILPIYQIVLLIYGFLFGQFRFFWAFERKMLQRFRILPKDNPTPSEITDKA
ncbi:MAG: hypothetical protein EAZ55_06015 [Cytophagales bacterium]|nr:MAG: hypothetical protein EAZ55_06015 [Cytophagales bacterium]